MPFPGLLFVLGLSTPPGGSRGYNVVRNGNDTRIVRIGNSRGIRVPKAVLDEAQLPDQMELHAQPGRLVVVGAKRP